MSHFEYRVGARTDVGVVRDHNEDAFVCRDEIGLWAVSDGMGGHAKGEVASAAIVKALGELGPVSTADTARSHVEGALRKANTEIFSEGQRDGATIGATVVALRISGRVFQAIWAGDSRIYLLRAGQLYRLTVDHTRVQELLDQGLLTPSEAENHPLGHVLARAVGVEPGLALDVVEDEVEEGDQFLLCSDGLTGVINDDQIAETLRRVPPEQAVSELVQATLAGGAPDNVTVVIVACLPSAVSTGTVITGISGSTGHQL